MNYGNMQEKEPRSPWLAIKFGCCASKEDLANDGSDTLKATGTFDFHSISHHHGPLLPIVPSFRANVSAVSFIHHRRQPLIPKFNILVEMHHATSLHSP
jgi:hypothetical protein